MRSFRAKKAVKKEEFVIMQPKYKRVLLKLSGEALAGDQKFGLNHEVIAPVVEQIVQIHNMGVQVSLSAAVTFGVADRERTWTERRQTTWVCSPPL